MFFTENIVSNYQSIINGFLFGCIISLIMYRFRAEKEQKLAEKHKRLKLNILDIIFLLIFGCLLGATLGTIVGLIIPTEYFLWGTLFGLQFSNMIVIQVIYYRAYRILLLGIPCLMIMPTALNWGVALNEIQTKFFGF